MTDRSFASDVSRFQKNIYDTSKGKIRQAVLTADLKSLIEWEKPLRVLDVGAGMGQVNQLFAQADHQVTHTDIAAEMVQFSQQAHAALGLESKYQYYHCSLQELPEVLSHEPPFDVILCHAVLEWLDEPFSALRLLNSMLADKGWLSLMFYNREAKTMANLVYGNFDYVKAGLKVKKKVRFSPQQPLSISQVKNWLTQFPLTLCVHSGVRCIHDYLRDLEHQTRDDLVTMELAYRRQEPYRSLGRYQHFLLRKN